MRIPFNALFIMKPSILVGAQAVIEGVMMGVPGAITIAVRDPKGKICIKRKPFFSITEKSKFWKKPILIDIASLFEAILFRIIRKPGLWLQNFTTNHPEDDMLEVTIGELKSAFGDEYENISGKKYIAEAIG